jgi:hypothetical protein
LRAVLPLRLALPALEPFLAENVSKEIRKDARVIQQAATALAAGERPGPGAARQLLGAARELDREFLARVGAFPLLRIRIRYEAIEPLRLQRIELGLETAYRILEAWQAGRRLQQAFAPGEMQRRVFDLLRLYARETLALSDSVQLPGILAPLRGRIAQRLEQAMMHAARTLTAAAPGKPGRIRPFQGR